MLAGMQAESVPQARDATRRNAMTTEVIWLRYVPIHELLTWLAKGWAIADDLQDTHHGAHACLCIWEGEGEPS